MNSGATSSAVDRPQIGIIRVGPAESAQQRPFLSIVVATFNAGMSIDSLIESLNSQTDSSFEVLVSDGGSRDETMEKIRGIRQLAWHDSRPDTGVYNAWNRAMPHISGTYTMFLGADDRLSAPDAIAHIKSALERNQQAHAAYGIVTRCKPSSWSSVSKGADPWDIARDRLPDKMPFHHSGSVMRSDLVKQGGGFDESFKIISDFDKVLTLHLDKSLEPVVFVDAPIVDIRLGGVSSSIETRMRMFRETMQMRRKHRLSPLSPACLCWWMRIQAMRGCFCILGDKRTRRLADFIRISLGKPRNWG